MNRPPALKPLYWVGSAKSDLGSLPSPVEDLFGYALYLAQGAAGVLEKKSKRGSGTPKADIDLIRERLKVGEQFAKELMR
jgi:phage-related protein